MVALQDDGSVERKGFVRAVRWGAGTRQCKVKREAWQHSTQALLGTNQGLLPPVQRLFPWTCRKQGVGVNSCWAFLTISYVARKWLPFFVAN